jgi:Ca2+-binding EF-hand superfamily protein
VFGFAVILSQFEMIMAFKPNLCQHVSLEELFSILDDDHDGRIDGLELLGGLALCCRGIESEKRRFCFNLYDFNRNSALSRQEMIMMMMASSCGINILTGGGAEHEPALEVFEDMADSAISAADSDKSGTISFSEFDQWADRNLALVDWMRELKVGLLFRFCLSVFS